MSLMESPCALSVYSHSSTNTSGLNRRSDSNPPCSTLSSYPSTSIFSRSRRCRFTLDASTSRDIAGFVSVSVYWRLDNFDLAENVLPILQRLEGAHFESVELTETKMYLKVITPRVELEVAPGDIVQAGIVITNSEVACGHSI